MMHRIERTRVFTSYSATLYRVHTRNLYLKNRFIGVRVEYCWFKTGVVYNVADDFNEIWYAHSVKRARMARLR